MSLRAVRTPRPRIKCTRCGRSVAGKAALDTRRRGVNAGAPAKHRCPHGKPCLVLTVTYPELTENGWRQGLELACVDCDALHSGSAENPRPVSSVQEGTLGLVSCSADALHELSESERAAVKLRSR